MPDHLTSGGGGGGGGEPYGAGAYGCIAHRERARAMRAASVAIVERASELRELHLDIDPHVEICEALARVPCASELEALTLVRIDDDMGRALLAAIARLPKLKTFASATDAVARELNRELEAATGGVREPSRRFVPIGE